MRTKPKSIRSKIILSLVVPVVALSALWGMAVAASVNDAVALRSAHNLRDLVGRPCDLMVEALQTERSRSQEFLAAVPPDAAALRAQRATTDAAVAEFRRLSAQYDGQGLAADVTRDRHTARKGGGIRRLPRRCWPAEQGAGRRRVASWPGTPGSGCAPSAAPRSSDRKAGRPCLADCGRS